MNPLAKFLREKRNVERLLAPADYRRWRGLVWRSLPSVLARRSLGIVDDRMGEHLAFRSPAGQELRTSGASLGVVREIFGQHCYATPAELRDARHILDLGGNAGVFTLYALSCAPAAQVHTVEAQPAFIPVITANVAANGFAARSSVENALVGGAWNEWAQGLRAAHPQIGDFNPARYFSTVGECDFLKCDVEGAEFAFFSGDLAWLRQVRQIALEYHGDWAAGTRLGDAIAAVGFEVRQATHGSLGYVFARRR
jgi:hypothetical protein